MALGILDGKPFDSPIHEGILLTCMLEFLPYDDSDKSEFSEERFHSYLSRLNDEIIEEKRRMEPPESESPNQMLMQIQQTLGQIASARRSAHSVLFGTRPDISWAMPFYSHVAAYNTSPNGRFATRSTPARYVGPDFRGLAGSARSTCASDGRPVACDPTATSGRRTGPSTRRP